MEDPYPVENIKRLCVFMFQTWDNSQLSTDSQYSSQTIVSSLKHKNTQPLYIFNWENPQNSEPQNGPRRGLDFIALVQLDSNSLKICWMLKLEMICMNANWNYRIGCVQWCNDFSVACLLPSRFKYLKTLQINKYFLCELWSSGSKMHVN